MSGFDYRGYQRKLDNLRKVEKGIRREMNYAVIALASKFVEVLEYNSPYDTGLLEQSWTWNIERAGDRIHIIIWNTAKNKVDGNLYTEWVNDGHAIKRDGVQIGYVEGQFFIELSEFEMHQQIPKWEKATSRRIAQIIKAAMKG